MGLSSLKIRWISTDFCRPAKCRPCFLGGKVGTVMHSSCFTQKLLIPISAAKQHGPKLCFAKINRNLAFGSHYVTELLRKCFCFPSLSKFPPKKGRHQRDAALI